MAAAPGEYHLFRQVQRVVYHCLEVGFGQQDLSSLPDDIRVDQATFTRLCTEIGEHFPQDRLQTQASLEEQVSSRLRDQRDALQLEANTKYLNYSKYPFIGWPHGPLGATHSRSGIQIWYT